jgi:hypothetical protein
VDHERIVGLDLEQPRVVLGAGVGVAGFLPVDEEQGVSLVGLPVTRCVNGEGVDRSALGVGLVGQTR